MVLGKLYGTKEQKVVRLYMKDYYDQSLESLSVSASTYLEQAKCIPLSLIKYMVPWCQQVESSFMDSSF